MTADTFTWVDVESGSTNEYGYLEFGTGTSLDDKVLYCVEETEAPAGYVKSDVKTYCIFIKTSGHEALTATELTQLKTDIGTWKGKLPTGSEITIVNRSVSGNQYSKEYSNATIPAPTDKYVEISKKLDYAPGATAEPGDSDKEFEFKVTVRKPDNSIATDLEAKVYGDIALENGVGTFKLKANAKKKLDIPVGYKYEIEEMSAPGYVSSITSGQASGVVEANIVKKVEFTNTKQQSSSGGGGGGGGSSKPTDPEKKPDDTTKPEDPEKPAETPKPDETPKPEVTPIPNEPVDPSDPDAIVVDFESEIGITPPPQIKRPGMTADDPQTKPDPSTLKPGTVIDGHRFEGWYIDKEFTKPYDFDTILTDDITLYAKWVKIGGAKSPKTDDMSFPLAGAMGITLIMLLSLWALSDKRYKKTR